MTKKKHGSDEIGRIAGAGSTKGIKGTESVSEVDHVKEATAIRGISGVTSVNQAGGVHSIKFEQRDKLLAMISEEANKLAAQGVIPKSQREVVEKAVRMVIDAALLDPSTEDDSNK